MPRLPSREISLDGIVVGGFNPLSKTQASVCPVSKLLRVEDGEVRQVERPKTLVLLEHVAPNPPPHFVQVENGLDLTRPRVRLHSVHVEDSPSNESRGTKRPLLLRQRLPGAVCKTPRHNVVVVAGRVEAKPFFRQCHQVSVVCLPKEAHEVVPDVEDSAARPHPRKFQSSRSPLRTHYTVPSAHSTSPISQSLCSHPRIG